MRITAFTTIVHLATSWLVGVSLVEELMPLPTIMFHLVLNILGFVYMRRYVKLSMPELLRAVPDSINYAKNFLQRRRS